MYARLHRRRPERVVCGRLDCGAQLGEVKVVVLPLGMYPMEVGGQPSENDYRELGAGARYVELLSGFMGDTDDDVWDVSPSRLAHWRSRGLPAAPRFAHGTAPNIPVLPTRIRCPRCRLEQVLDAGLLGIAQRS